MTPDMPAPGRSCAGCTLCCKVMGVRSLDKPIQRWCTHCQKASGCAIYPDRPQECRDFLCAWLTSLNFAEHWAPARSKMIICSAPSIPRLEIHVDEGRPDAWRREPYYSDLKAWSRAAAADGGHVMVYLSQRAIMILPHKDVDLGIIGPDDQLTLTSTMTPSGPLYDVVLSKAAAAADAA